MKIYEELQQVYNYVHAVRQAYINFALNEERQTAPNDEWLLPVLY